MWYELHEGADLIELRTADLELGWSRESGALMRLRRPGGPSALGHGPPIAGVDVMLGAPGGWIAAQTFARYIWHRLEAGADEVALTVIGGLGPLKIFDRYAVRGALVERSVRVENAGPDDLRLGGVRMILPHAQVGAPASCMFDAPGNSARPRVTLAVAATQDRAVLPRRFFAPGLRGGSALEPAPSQGPGLLALHSADPPLALLCWYAGADEAALPYLQGRPGVGDAVSLAHEVGVAGWLRAGQSIAGGPQRLLLLAAAWPAALAAYRAAMPAAGDGAGWLADAVLYAVDLRAVGGAAAMRAALPAVADLGVDTLCLLPLHTVGERPHLIGDLERIDPLAGDAAALADLVAAAHDRGMRVLLDMATQGCAADSRYLSERPEWFMRDDAGGFVIGMPADAPAAARHPGVAPPAGCYSLDWLRPDWRAYWLGWAGEQIDRLALDGVRAVAPVSAAPAWGRRPPQRASEGSAALRETLAELRSALRRARPDGALLSTLAGPGYAALADGCFDYPAHQMLFHLALRRVTAAELGSYLADREAVGAAGRRIGFLEAHDTCEVNPLADGMRGSRLSRAILAAMLLCGLTPALWAGQEAADGAGLRALLGLWRAEPALRRGSVDYAPLAGLPADVLAVRRDLAGRALLGLVNVGPHPRRISAAAAVGRDLLGLAPLGRERRAGGAGLTLAPFGTYCLELG